MKPKNTNQLVYGKKKLAEINITKDGLPLEKMLNHLQISEKITRNKENQPETCEKENKTLKTQRLIKC